jgi:hypothetical protein
MGASLCVAAHSKRKGSREDIVLERNDKLIAVTWLLLALFVLAWAKQRRLYMGGCKALRPSPGARYCR